MTPENSLLGEALTGTETAQTATPDLAQVEQTQPEALDQSAQPDSSLQTSESGEQPKAEATQSQLDFKELRERRDHLNSLVDRFGGEEKLTSLHTRINELGGDSHLELMQPVLQRAMEIPRTQEEVKVWADGMYEDLSKSLMPIQVNALRSQAAWSYLEHPQSQETIVKAVYGDDMTPKLLQDLVAAYRTDPTVVDVLHPYGETDEQRTQREAREARDRQADEDNARRDAELQAIKDREQAFYTQQVMTGVFQTALAPRAEVKKQYGLEYEKNTTDTPEIAAFKERASSRYDRMVTYTLERDAELNRLASQAEHMAKQPSEQVRQRAQAQFAPLMEARVRAVSAQVAKDLAMDLQLFSPELSDRTKAANLRDIPPQVLGSSPSGSSTGYNLEGMPNAATDPIGFGKWLLKNFPTQGAAPPILTAG